MNFLKPDKNTKLIHLYHKTNYTILPLIFLSYFESKLNINSVIAYNTMICNISYHSYVSCSTMITDYIKHNGLKKTLRTSNLGIHLIASIGYLKIYK